MIVANKVRTAIQRPFDNGKVCVQVSASIGVSVYPDHGVEEHVLIKNADIAMYYAKEEGGDAVRFFGHRAGERHEAAVAQRSSARAG